MFKDEGCKFENQWAEGVGVIKHSAQTKNRIKDLQKSLDIKSSQLYKMLGAADKIASFAMWIAVHQTYAQNIYTDGRQLAKEDFKSDPQGHLGAALNMIPAYVGYMLANAISNHTRGWVMEQGHAVTAIDSVNLILNNMKDAHSKRYSLTDSGLSRFAQDFYSYKINSKGEQDSPLGSHVNANTAGGCLEGGYLGFASLQYVHMPLKGERLVAFLSDGAFEEQKGADWTQRWWRAEDSGLICPIMIANGRRIDQRTTMDQEGGASWFAKYLKIHDFEPLIFDGRDPAAFAWAILTQEQMLIQNAGSLDNVNKYDIKIPYGIAVAPKGAGFYNEGTNYAHNLPLVTNPSKDRVAAERFNSHAAKLYIPLKDVEAASSILQNHASSKRVLERDNTIANRDVALAKSPALRYKKPDGKKKKSTMDAIDMGFLMTVKANPHLRPRVGNPDEMLSNKMDDTLEELKFRVTEAEGSLHESTMGAVITALNEEAVAAAAFGNKGGINIIVTYEAFGSKMFGGARQEVIFSKHKKDYGQNAGWLSVPVVMTSNTWENSKNELSHQDPSMAESMLGETSDISRVMFAPDYNGAIALMKEVYKTQGQIWTIVASKQDTEIVFSQKESQELVENGAIRVKSCEYSPAKAQIAIVAIGSYQLIEAMAASKRLLEKKVPHIVSYIIEPGRFRKARNKGEEEHLAKKSVINTILPANIKNVVVASHTRPEIIEGMLSGLLADKKAAYLGFINQGGTLNVSGMLYMNRCGWAHILHEIAASGDIKPEKILSKDEISAVDAKIPPQGIIF